jgi:hypothetical protein
MFGARVRAFQNMYRDAILMRVAHDSVDEPRQLRQGFEGTATYRHIMFAVYRIRFLWHLNLRLCLEYVFAKQTRPIIGWSSN